MRHRGRYVGRGAKGGLPLVILVGLGAVLSVGAIGCLSGDTSVVPPYPGFDAGLFDSGFPILDASGAVDAQGSVDASRLDAAVTVVGLVPGGQTSHSPSFTFTGTAGATHAPVATSPHYKLIGGMAAAAQKP